MLTTTEAALVTIMLSVARDMEREQIVDELREQACAQVGQVGDQRRRGAINHAADRVRDRRGPGRPEDLVCEQFPVIPEDERRPLGSLFPRAGVSHD